MKKLYEYHLDCGSMGYLEGLFIAEETTLDTAIGKMAYFGGVLGKHSEIYSPVRKRDLTVKSDDQDFITQLEGLLGATISGFNPLEHIEGD